MALNLDLRQRAMLKAMGITVWLPEPACAVAASLESQETAAAAPSEMTQAPAPVRTPVQTPAQAPVRTPAQVPAPAPAPVPAPEPPPAATPAPADRPARRFVQQPAAGAPGLGWRLGRARPVYPAATDPAVTEGGWLILLEPPANTLALPHAQRPGPDCARTALEGDAARLLDNMLRALNLHRHPRVYSAALHRVEPGAEGQASPDGSHPSEVPTLQPALQALLRELRPTCVLVLGLASARAVLERHEALGRLRAEPHRLAGVPTVVTYDPNYLLRAPQAKAGAWADLCHAHAFVTGAA